MVLNVGLKNENLRVACGSLVATQAIREPGYEATCGVESEGCMWG